VKEELEKLRNEVLISISQASTEKELSEIRVGVLGRKGSLTLLLKRLGTLPEEDRR
jgi:phenylalanyl-tRNA synthetase alpha chain